MTPILNVYPLPDMVTPEQLAGGTVVVIDVLRASTTIVHALEAGATEVIPCQEVDDARAVAERLPRETVVLGGERKGLRIDGFDLGNSPTDYTPSTVGSRTVVFTTTNGTRAMAQCRLAERVLIGTFVNASAVLQQLAGQEQVHLLCAGTRGRYGRDDLLMAGLLVERLQQQEGTQRVLPYRLNAEADQARESWNAAFPPPRPSGAEPLDPELLAAQLRESIGGRNLTAVGLEADILTAARLDRFRTVPELDPRAFRIRLP